MLVAQSLAFGLLIFLVAFYASFLWKRRRLYYLASKLPGPKGLPLVGQAHRFLNADFKDIFDYFVAVPNDYPTPMKIWLGPELVVFADSPESLQIVLNSPKCLDKSPFYDEFVLTKGLLVCGGNMWRNHRRIMNPAFSISVLQKLIPTFDEKSKILLKNLEAEVGKEAFDVYGYITACSMETLLKGTMDVDRDYQSDALTNEFFHHVEMLVETLLCKF